MIKQCFFIILLGFSLLSVADDDSCCIFLSQDVSEREASAKGKSLDPVAITGGQFLVLKPIVFGGTVGNVDFADGYSAPVICSSVSLLWVVGASGCGFVGPATEGNLKYAKAIKNNNSILEIAFFGFLGYATAFGSLDCLLIAPFGLGVMNCSSK